MSNRPISLKSTTDQFRDAMLQRGITPPETIDGDGKVHRFSSNGKPDDDAGWYVFHDSDIAIGAFGDFRTGQFVSSWEADLGRKLSPAEKAGFRSKQEEIRIKREAEISQGQARAREKAAWMLKNAKPAHDGHPYLLRKNVKSYGIRDRNGMLVIPLIDNSGEVHSTQTIQANGGKKFLSGGRTQGCYFPIGKLTESDMILIAEGYATAATIHEITGHPVVVAFNAGNLLAVSKSIRAQYPGASLYVCADDDIKTKCNPGISKATEAAETVGASVIVPVFGKDRPDGVTDFNDMAAHLGKDAVTRFFIDHFLAMGDRRQRYEPSDVSHAAQGAFFTKPATQCQTPGPHRVHEKDTAVGTSKETTKETTEETARETAEETIKETAEETMTGIITDFGVAPYKFDTKNNTSFRINIESGDKTRTLWGLDLRDALARSRLGIHDEVAIHYKGKRPVQTVRIVRDGKGDILREEPCIVMRGAWDIEPLDTYLKACAEQQRENVQPLNIRDDLWPSTYPPELSPQESAATFRQSGARKAVPVPPLLGELKAHFSATEFEAVQQIWGIVPYKMACHSEAGYDLVLEEKQKVTITRDSIELSSRPCHRPDVAYSAACEHARLFWNGQMEVRGDAQHCVKAWAYAKAHGIKVTNFTPNALEFIEVEKMMVSLRNKADPAFTRPKPFRGHTPRPRPTKFDA